MSVGRGKKQCDGNAGTGSEVNDWWRKGTLGTEKRDITVNTEGVSILKGSGVFKGVMAIGHENGVGSL